MNKMMIGGLAAVTFFAASGAVFAHGKAGANGLIDPPSDVSTPTATGHGNAKNAWDNLQPDGVGQNDHPDTGFDQDISRNPLTESEE